MPASFPDYASGTPIAHGWVSISEMDIDDRRSMTVKEVLTYLQVHPSTVYRALKTRSFARVHNRQCTADSNLNQLIVGASHKKARAPS